MIAISPAAKYKCKFAGSDPPTPSSPPTTRTRTHTRARQNPWLECIIMLLGRVERSIFKKKNTLNRRQTYFIFCQPPGFVTHSSICLRTLLCMWTRQRRPGTPGHERAHLPERQKKRKNTHREETQKQPLPLILESSEGTEGRGRNRKCNVVIL